MKNHLNQLSRAWALGLTLCICMAGASLAQTTSFPNKALKIVVPNAAGGAADITARTVGQKLSEALGQPVVIENKPSAGGIVAGEQVARSDPDGHDSRRDLSRRRGPDRVGGEESPVSREPAPGVQPGRGLHTSVGSGDVGNLENARAGDGAERISLFECDTILTGRDDAIHYRRDGAGESEKERSR